ncbi:MAG TPA: hypothetical protein VHK90_10665, partial [Thermoanaerobaculia bacterium]|nr:hypothetical protein [Thermoanaerobaculia bacterium]
STSPAIEGWPAAGSTVTWRAHVRNWSAAPRTLSYVWRVNGVEVKQGSVSLAANAYTTVDLPRTWTFTRERLSFDIAGESLEIFTDALAVGFWVEQSVYEHFRIHQPKLGIGSESFDDWAQRTIGFYNDMAALAVYPETPNGVHDRWRVQKIVIVPDDALPLNGLPDDASPGANGGSHPDKDDRTVDLMWGFREDVWLQYANTTDLSPSNQFYLGYGVLHEMGHARYLVDIYAWNVFQRAPNHAINITENGTRIVGNYIPSRGFRTPEQGLMNEHYTFIDRYSAIALNFIAGRRAVMGNYNEPRNFGEFLNDFPRENRLTVRDRNGTPIPNADVWFYYSVANGEAWYATNYDDVPDLKLRTDEKGQVLVGRAPFATNGKVVHTYGMTNGVAIVRVATDAKVEYGFLESRLFNLAYWRGNTDFADHDLFVGLECDATGPRLAAPAWNTTTDGNVTLDWDPLAGATLYRVYASTNLGRPRVIATTTATEANVKVSGRTHWWVEAEVGTCGTRRSATGLLNAPAAPATAPRRRAVRH